MDGSGGGGGSTAKQMPPPPPPPPAGGGRERRRRRRWGDAPPTTTQQPTQSEATATSSSSGVGDGGGGDVVAPAATAPAATSTAAGRVLSMQQSIRARLAAAKAKAASSSSSSSAVAAAARPSAATSTASLKRPAAAVDDVPPSNKNQVKRARHYELDMSVTGPTYRTGTDQQQQQEDETTGQASATGGDVPEGSDAPVATGSSDVTGNGDGGNNKKTKTRKRRFAVIEQPAKPKKPINPYLAHRQAGEEVEEEGGGGGGDAGDLKQKEPQRQRREGDPDGAGAAASDEIGVDDRLVRASKPRQRHKALSFVEPGTYQKLGEKKREKALKAEISGYVSGRKVGHTIRAAGIASAAASAGVNDEDDVYGGGGGLLLRDDDAAADRELLEIISSTPRYDANPDAPTPLAMEWWDTVSVLPPKLKRQVANLESAALRKQSRAAMMNKIDGGGGAGAGGQAAGEEEVRGDERGGSKKTGEDERGTSEIETLREACYRQASLSYSKTAELVQHIAPVRPSNLYGGPPKQPVLHMTKKELKRQRKLRRQEKQREIQDLQSAGLIPPPEPRLTLQNFIRVLGDQAYLDPSQMEQKVVEQIEARRRAHRDRNESNKLTKEQRSAKRSKKLLEDTSEKISVALFYVRDMSHPYHRAKVDLNARQNNITGAVVQCASAFNDGDADPSPVSCVICEGGPRAILRYKRLMLVRMKWTGPPDQIEDDDEDDDDIDYEGDGGGDGDDGDQTGAFPAAAAPKKFDPTNRCELVWEGMSVRRLFRGFAFQSCETSDQARGILKSRGAEHYWDQVARCAAKQRGRHDDDDVRIKLAPTTAAAAGDDHDDDDNPYAMNDDDDIVMRDA